MPKTIASYDKLKRLHDIIENLAPVVLSYSGGSDSSFLLWACARILSVSQILAVTFCSATTPYQEIQAAKETANLLNVNHLIFPGPEMQNYEFIANDLLRCYYCKRERFAFLSRQSFATGANIIEGSVVDDLNDYRPGMRAISEAGISSPLLEAGISKDDICLAAGEHNLPFVSRKSESCLATRIKTGQCIDTPVLAQIQRAENVLHELGFAMVRVRWNLGEARLEFSRHDLERAFILRSEIIRCLQKCGFTNVALDLEGYKTAGKEKI